MTLNPFIIDCDTGRDDALAIWLALGMKLPLTGVVASYGNVELSRTAENTARVLALAGREDIPLLAGSAGPLRPHGNIARVIHPRHKSSGNGLCDVELPPAKRPPAAPLSPERLAQEIAAIAEEHGRLDYIITGPATNFAALCGVMGPDIHRIVARVTMMGGKLELWDRLPGADFNLACDPCAVRTILESGFAARFVPMDATWPVSLTLEEIGRLEAPSAVAARAKEIMTAYCLNFAPEPVFRFHDPCAVLAAASPGGFSPSRVSIACDDERPDFGRLAHAADGFPAQIFSISGEARESLLAAMLGGLGLKRAEAARASTGDLS